MNNILCIRHVKCRRDCYLTIFQWSFVFCTCLRQFSHSSLIKNHTTNSASCIKVFIRSIDNYISSLISTLATNITTVANGLTGAKVSQWAQTTIPKLVVAAGQMIGKFAASLVANLPKIVLAIGRIGLSIVTGLGSALWGKVTAAANGIKDRFMKPINTMKDKVKGILDKIKGFFPVSLGKILHFSLPKISVSGGKAPWGIGGAGTRPSFSVSWSKHAEGGIFARRTIMAEGNTVHEFNERGREAILPLTPFWNKMDRIVDAFKNGSGGMTFNIYAAPGQDPREIAEEVKKIFITDVNRERLAWL